MAKLNKRHALMLRWGGATAILTLALAAVVVFATRRTDVMAPEADGTIKGLTSVLARQVDPALVTIHFEDATAASGIDFKHFPATRHSLIAEDMGSGCAWGDFDDDGDPDLFLVNYSDGLVDAQGAAIEPGASGDAGLSRLLRNDGGRFEDITHDAGLATPMRGHGAAWADFDGDDDLDLSVTEWGGMRLFRNDDGRFTDVTAEAGLRTTMPGADPESTPFSTGIAWFDADGDGWLDCYVCNYVDFAYRPGDAARQERQYGAEVPFTLNPSSYKPQPNRLWHNNGDGTFTDIAADVGAADPQGRSLSAAPMDFDMDGDTDLYVANDVSSNAVLRNRGDGTFEDIGAESLAADHRGAMGLGIADPDRDGDLDLFVTHWVAQENALYLNMWSADAKRKDGQRRLFFMDAAEVQGLGQISLNLVGWATGFADFDNDGLDDVWVANGHTLEDESDHARLRPQPLHVYRQVEGEGFFEMAAESGAQAAGPRVGRGGATADYDGDGRVDLLLTGHGERALLLRNTSDAPPGITVRLRQPGPNTRAVGAVVRVTTPAGTQMQQVSASSGYLSQNSLELHFGIGSHETAVVAVQWPDGMVSEMVGVGPGATLAVDHPLRSR